MIGMLAEHSSDFLRIVAVGTAVLFSIPIALAPLAWARALRWRVDGPNDLALYFARSLGALALVLSWAAWDAAGEPSIQPYYFKLYIGITALLTVVHIVGAVQKVQPWTETAEIPFWGTLAALGLLFYPGA